MKSARSSADYGFDGARGELDGPVDSDAYDHCAASGGTGACGFVRYPRSVS